jgi:signal transduction histidine kinase
MKLNKYYELVDRSAAKVAALALHLTYTWSYLEGIWRFKPAWTSSAKTRVSKPDPSRCTTNTINSRRPSTDSTTSSTATVVEAIKSGFVSSLSHELRSALHGCLAAAELLRETTLDVTQTDLVTMVQACSSTLLYILKHVMNFSKVNDHEAVKGSLRRDSDISAARACQNIFGQTSEDYPCRLTHDVIEDMHFSHTTRQAAYSRALNTSMSDHNESHLDPAMLPIGLRFVRARISRHLI